MAFAERVEKIAATADSATPVLSAHFHAGSLTKVHVDPDLVFR